MTTPLTVVLQADTKDLEAGLEKGGGGIDLFGQKVSGGMLLAGGAVVAAAGVAISAIADWTQAAIDDAAEQDALALAIENAGAATATSTAQVEAAIAAGQERAFTDSQTREALTGLIGATGDVASATELLSTAQDVARLSGVDLQTATDAVRKAYDGNGAQLAKLTDQQTKGLTSTEILTNAQKLAAGQADLYGESTKGAMEKSQIAMDEATESIGSAFIPIVEAIVPALVPVLEAIAMLVNELLPLLRPVIDVAVAGIKILVEVLKTVIGILHDVIAAVKSVIDWIGQMADIARNAVATVQGAIDAVNPFSVEGSASVNSLGAMALDAAPRASGGGGGGGGSTVNVQVMSADPEQVVRAIRRWARNNGGSGPFTRGLDRSTA
jgi:hypothetical protein